MYVFWYPGAYFKLMGGAKLIKLIACVDIFLGPLLTFIVFKQGKKNLRLDLFCIAMLQVTALIYGIYVMFTARPVFTVFNKTSFQVASLVDIDPRELAKGKKEEWRSLSITGPRIVAINPDKSNKEELMLVKTEGEAACRYPRVYDDYAKRQEEVIKVGKTLYELAEISQKNKSAVNAFLKKINRRTGDFLFLPITSAVSRMSAIIDAKTGEFIQIIDADPVLEKFQG
jgi:hypothetical protein